MEDYFRELIRGIDSSLLEEWERLRNPDFVAADADAKPAQPATFDLSARPRGLSPAGAHRALGVLQDVAVRDWGKRRRAPGEARPALGRRRRRHSRGAPDRSGVRPLLRRPRPFPPRCRGAGRQTHPLDRRTPPGAPEWSVAHVLIDRRAERLGGGLHRVARGVSRAEPRGVAARKRVAPIGA